MEKTIKFIRDRKKITNTETGEVEVFPSISKAKQWSRLWQLANGGLGTAPLAVKRREVAKPIDGTIGLARRAS